MLWWEYSLKNFICVDWDCCTPQSTEIHRKYDNNIFTICLTLLIINYLFFCWIDIIHYFFDEHDIIHYWAKTKGSCTLSPLMKLKVTSLVCSLSMSMDEANFLLRAKRVKVKDTGLVPAKGHPILKLDNLSSGIYSIL